MISKVANNISPAIIEPTSAAMLTPPSPSPSEFCDTTANYGIKIIVNYLYVIVVTFEYTYWANMQ